MVKFVLSYYCIYCTKHKLNLCRHNNPMLQRLLVLTYIIIYLYLTIQLISLFKIPTLLSSEESIPVKQLL